MKKTGIVLFAVIIFGAVLRLYNYSDNLVFKSDQARDALIMEQAVESSILNMSLLGAQVGGTNFRLGPVHYYFQYLSGKFFGVSPESFAYPDLFWGLLTLPLLFLLFRRFFSVSLSLWLTMLASCSIFLVTFSRFDWNPNSLQFFTTLFTLLFLHALDSKGVKRWWLLGGAAIGFGIIAQLHFMAVLALSLGIVMFLLFSRTLNWKELIFCLAAVVIVQLPVIVYEIRTGGSNSQELFNAIDKKESQERGHYWHEKIFRAYQESSNIIWLVATGNQNTDEILTRGFSFKCDKKCQTSLPYSLAAMLVFCCALISVYYARLSAINENQKRAITLVLSWFGAFFVITAFLAYQLETRFYLSVVPLLYLFLGFLMQGAMNVSGNIHVKRIIIIIGIVMVLLNLKATVTYLHELTVSSVSEAESGRDLRFGTAPKVTLGQLRAIAAEARRNFDQNSPVLVSGESLYVKAMYYLISVEQGYDGCYVHGEVDDIPAGFHNIAITYTKSISNAKLESNQDENLSLKVFGTMAATFRAEDDFSPKGLLPEKCLTY